VIIFVHFDLAKTNWVQQVYSCPEY